MIPIRLQVRNFLCYGDEAPPLLFDGFRLACLSGENGHGKSALLDALTWVLWGQARAKSDDDLVRHGQSEMEVELEFAVGDERYRVIRKRSRPKRARGAGTTVLELHHWENGGFRAITGDSIRDTERRIVQILGMQYETFINSALLLQGRADEFTVKPPSERKKVLADVLGLGYFDELEKRARERSRLFEQRQRELGAQIAEHELELAERPRYEEDERQLRALAAEAEGAVQQAQHELDLMRERKRTLDAQAESLEEVRRRLKRLDSEVGQRQRDLQERQAELDRVRSVVERRKVILDGFQLLQVARWERARLDEALQSYVRLANRQREVERQMAEAKTRVSSALAVQRDAFERSRCAAAELESRRAAVQTAQADSDALGQREQLLADRRQALAELSEELGRMTAQQDRLKGEMADLKERITLLEKDAARCPLCETELGEDNHRRLLEKYQAEGRQRGDVYRANHARIKQLTEGRSTVERELKAEDAQVRERRDVVGSALARAQHALDEAEQLAAQLADRREALESLERSLATGSYAGELLDAFEQLTAEIQALRYDEARHDAARLSVRELEEYEGLKRELDDVTTRIDSLQAAVTQAQESLESVHTEYDQDRAREAGLIVILPEREDLGRQIADRQRRIEALGRELAMLHSRHGAARQRVETCDRLEQLTRERRSSLAEAAREKSIYDELAVAFGKRGIQAMLIESALPELTEDANALLARMTDNRMSLAIDTQRDTKKGETVETLDIRIADELGTRPYELFSGGESFRVNFAIRIALSRLLARRAGSQLRMLIIDEGFGTQDAAGREKLVEAINVIQEDFEKILVITHLDELKDHFPVRIEVTKQPTGSMLFIS